MSLDIAQFNLSQIVTAIGGLGTAAFGLLDACKSLIPHVNRIGLGHIHDVVGDLTPESREAGAPLNALRRRDILKTVEANWVNGMDLNSQKAVAKSLIKLHLNAENAGAVAAHCNVDSESLVAIAKALTGGEDLTAAQQDANSRFDMILTAVLDEAYQISDQNYRNHTRALAALIAVLLALAGSWSMEGTLHYWATSQPVLAFLVGLLATPLAPIAKDLSTALASAVNTMQVLKRKGA